jgi:hypothetical protein
VLQGGLLSDAINFSIDAGFLATLPKTINPGDSINPLICFNPQDQDSHTGTLTWKTDIPSSLDSRMKTISLLNGKGYNAGVEWLPTQLTMVIDTGKAMTQVTNRVYLANHGTTKKVNIQSFYISGPDSSEFAVAQNEFGFDPPFSINTSDSLWLDVRFKPDMSNGSAVRSAYLNVNYTLEGSGATQSAVEPVFGSFTSTTTGSVTERSGQSAVRAFLVNGRLVLFLPDNCQGHLECTMYDVLGRKVFSGSAMAAGVPVSLQLGWLPEGLYIVHITNGSSLWSVRVIQSR